jgi:hypothetical protein
VCNFSVVSAYLVTVGFGDVDSENGETDAAVENSGMWRRKSGEVTLGGRRRVHATQGGGAYARCCEELRAGG